MSHQPGPYRGGGRGGGGDRGGRSHQSGPQRGGGDRGGFGGGRGQEQGPYRGRGDRGGFSGGRGQQPAPYRGGGDGDRVGRGGRGPVSSTPHPTSSSFNQSAPTPAPTSKPTREVGSSSSSASSATVDQTLATELKTKLTLPTSSKGVRTPPVRPGFGKAGKQCVVKANHFLVSLQDREFHHYDVSITPEVVSRKLNRIAMTQLVKLYGNSHLNGLQPVYDGRKGLYTAGPLPFENKDFHVKWKEGSREREFKVAIKLVGKPHVHHLLEFLSRRQREAPMDVIQVLDIVLRETPSQSYTSVGRSFYDPKFGQFMVGDGLEGWKGYYQSLRPTQMGLSLNIDVAATAFNEGIPVIDYVQKLINPRDPSRPLSPMDCAKIKKALRGLRVELTHTKGAKQHKVSGITPLPTNQLTFPDASGQQIFVTRYYLEKYKINLRFGHWPAIHAGSNSRPAYLPFEVCKVIPGQRFTKKLNERQVTAILKAACQRPSLREANISDIAEHNNYSNDEFAKRFGITVNPSLTIIQDARILPAPMLKYHDSGKDRSIQPNIGQWNMINAVTKMVNGAAVKYWTCVNFSRLHHEAVSRFVETLVSMCNKKGMNFNPRPLIPIDRGHADRIEQTLFEIHNLSTERLNSLGVQGNLELLIIILPDFTGTYGTIKRICETELGIVSQCCKPLQVSKNSPQYHENVALKINVKAGGRNTVLADALQKRIPLVTDAPTIIFGADVTHPSPGEDSSPSIAAVVASMDWPEVTKYRALVSTQKPEEIINELEAMVRTLMRAFRRSTGCKPQRIIFYRDGVGEGQFSEVLLKEVDAVMKACQSIEEGYLPPITFVIVQKRHHTRLFPADHSNRRMTDKSGNILPGTVVDTQICHPSEFDFYLCSHAGIQGTSRPTHYHVLWDQNGFTADQIQTLTNNLCYTYARCTRSVSIVPPAYYAHLAAFRARYYVEDVMVSESGNSRGGEGVVRPLPVIKDNVKDVMFYC